MKALDYQARVLDTLDVYLDHLAAAKSKADQVEDLKIQKPDLPIPSLDYAEEAWKKMKEGGRLPLSCDERPFSPRRDGASRAVPNVTLKVPTGGGKTYLAVNAVSRIFGRYLGKNTGFVLWVVPNEAIYSQTLKNLRDRDHAYRQVLDRASANCTKILEKSDHLNAMDVEGNLCVMLLMLQSGNRENKETLRMFRDRGDVTGFFPAEGEQQAHSAMIEVVPNLDKYDDFRAMVKDSLGNALRLIRPVVVIDEGQKATSHLANRTIYGFNPIFVLELTATPKDAKGTDEYPPRNFNLLVEVSGRDLHSEQMIKMPLNLEISRDNDWKTTLNIAVAKLNELQTVSEAHHGDTGCYIRPILLVQVERTGKDQRSGVHIHSEDVREWLEASGFNQAEIAVKTSDQNDLNQPENQNLLSENSRVRVIITKSALQEGWDCSFAYILCSLAASSSLSAMTQLVGRILRQPYATKTGASLLDECYVIARHTETGKVISSVKAGLETGGLADLVMEVSGGDIGRRRVARSTQRRDEFKGEDIYLPRVLWADEDDVRDIDYEADLLARLDWRRYDPRPIAASIPDSVQEAIVQMQRLGLSEDGKTVVAEKVSSRESEMKTFNPVYAVQAISDLVPNPFVARDIVEKVIKALNRRGFSEEKIGMLSKFIIDELRKELDRDRTNRAEEIFKKDVKSGKIQFRLRMDGRNWEMPKEGVTSQPKNSRVLVGSDGFPVKSSLFAPLYEADFNKSEHGVALMLDEAATIRWWHRNVAKSHYGLQGWKRGRIYPDFIFSVVRDSDDRRIVALETKGHHLQNPDTDYKRDVLKFLSEHFSWDDATSAGQLQLECTGERMECTLILMDDVQRQLPLLF